jgi:hypothetical protein
MSVLDKNGRRLRVGNWVLYTKLHSVRLTEDYFARRIKRISDGKVIVESEDWGRYSDEVEKLPSNKKEREQILFLRKLEQ